MHPLFLLVFFMSILSSCQQTAFAPGTASLPAATILNVSYGTDSLQRMDVYLPAGRKASTTPSLILIHGGGWNAGSKESFTAYVDSFKKRLPHYAFFNLDYQLVTGSHLFPTQEHDIRAAIQFISSNAAGYGVDDKRFVLLGASAGAHLALLQAYKYNDPAIRAVIDFFGPSDLLAMYQRPWHPLVTYALQMITGATPQTNLALYKASSPVNYITATSTPTLIFHGADDGIVDLSQSRILQKKLQSENVSHDLVVYEGERHGWWGATLSNSFDRIESFLETHVN